MNGRKVGRYSCIFLVVALCLSSLCLAQDSGLTIGIVSDGPWERDQQLRNVMESAVSEALRGTREVRFPETARLQGDWTRNGVRAAIDRLLADPQVDVVIAMGILGSYEGASRSYLPKPLIAARVVAPDLLHIPQKAEDGVLVSGVENLNYVTVASPDIKKIMQQFRDLVVFDRVTFVVMDPMRQIYPDLQDAVRILLRDLELERIDIIFARDDLAQVLRRFPTDTNAVVLTPLPQLTSEQVGELMDYLRQLKLPTLALGSRELVEAGAMLGMSTQFLPEEIAERVAQNLQKIAAGEQAGRLPVVIRPEHQLVINNGAAAAIGFDIQTLQQQAVAIEVDRRTMEPSMDAVVDDDDQPQLQRGAEMTEADLMKRQGEIITAVQKEIARMPAYSAFDSISFRVEGINRVVLLGFSMDATVKNEAERRLRSIEQVEEVVNLIEVLPLSRNDDRIRAHAYAAIYGHPSLSRYAPGGGFTTMDRRNFARDLQVGARNAQITRGPHPIHILVKNGHLALVGQVRTETDRQIAEMQARGILGVFSVENHLEVVGS